MKKLLALNAIGLALIALLIVMSRPNTTRDTGQPLSSSVVASKPDMRQEIDRVVREEVDTMGANLQETQVDAFLATLEARARAKGRVDGPEVEPGVEAIRRLEHRVGAMRVMAKIDAFGNRMRILAAQLRSRKSKS